MGFTPRAGHVNNVASSDLISPIGCKRATRPIQDSKAQNLYLRTQFLITPSFWYRCSSASMTSPLVSPDRKRWANPLKNMALTISAGQEAVDSKPWPSLETPPNSFPSWPNACPAMSCFQVDWIERFVLHVAKLPPLPTSFPIGTFHLCEN